MNANQLIKTQIENIAGSISAIYESNVAPQSEDIRQLLCSVRVLQNNFNEFEARSFTTSETKPAELGVCPNCDKIFDACDCLKVWQASSAIDHPPHYNAHPSGIECIAVVEHMGFNLGNAIKYIWRADEKNNAIEDLKKSKWYIERELKKRGADQ